MESLRDLRSKAEIWQALVVGLRDYVKKNGFPSVLLGLSGGIDSAVTAAIAADAWGPQKYLEWHCLANTHLITR
jgi:NAD+ synthase (glutamine-hydrolysing)